MEDFLQKLLREGDSDKPGYKNKIEEYSRLYHYIYDHFKRNRDPNLDAEKVKTRMMDCIVLAEFLETEGSSRPDIRMLDHAAEAYFYAAGFALELRDVERYRSLANTGRQQIFKAITFFGYTDTYDEAYFQERLDRGILEQRANEIESGEYHPRPRNWDWF